MFSAGPIEEFDPGLPGVHAFRIRGRVDRDAMAAMARHMLGVFDRAEQVDMLLVFETDETSTPGAGLSAAAVEAQARSLGKVRNYVVANAPRGVGGLVEAMGRLIPVEAQSFDTEEGALAWLGVQPPPVG